MTAIVYGCLVVAVLEFGISVWALAWLLDEWLGDWLKAGQDGRFFVRFGPVDPGLAVCVLGPSSPELPDSTMEEPK